MKRFTAPQVTQLSDSVFGVAGEAANWVILTAPEGITLIDGGYPGDYADVIASIRATGHSPADLRAIALTHAHVDHIGALPQLLERWPVPVYTSPEEARHARREYLQQATPLDVAMNIWRPGALAWTRHLIAKGAHRAVALPTAEGWAPLQPLPIPGAPVPVPLPGHTSGHTGYLLAAGSMILTGDALITGHPLSRHTGPQLLPRFFDHDYPQLLESLSTLETLDATIVLPGHGPVHHGPVRDAVQQARARAER